MHASRAHPPTGVAFFDIDGTLVSGTSSGAFLAQRLGHAAEVDEAEARYAAGAIDNHEVCVVDARGWAGTHQSRVDNWLEELPLIDGIDQTVGWCKSHGLVPVLASLAWEPVGAHLARRFGFSGHCGPQLETTAGIYTGEVAQTFDEFDKRDFALGVCHQLGVEPSRSIAIGDSRSDLPLFEVVGLSIALNGSADARARASTTLDSDSLVEAIPLIRSWMTAAQFVTPGTTLDEKTGGLDQN